MRSWIWKTNLLALLQTAGRNWGSVHATVRNFCLPEMSFGLDWTWAITILCANCGTVWLTIFVLLCLWSSLYGPRVQGRRQRCPAPQFKSVPPHFTVGLLVAAYIQYSIFKMWPPFWFQAPPFGFWPPLLLNPGDGPARVWNKLILLLL